jgi:hypothetical protein
MLVLWVMPFVYHLTLPISNGFISPCIYGEFDGRRSEEFVTDPHKLFSAA